MNRSETIGEYAKALVKFQGEVKNPKNSTKNEFYNSKYAPLDVVVNTIKEPLANHGLSYMQFPKTEDGYVVITTLVMHESGEWIESEPLKVPAWKDKKDGTKELNAQTVGIGITYARRYQLTSVLGISSEEDDDANGISVDQGGQTSANQQGREQYDKNKQQQKAQQDGKPASEAQVKYINSLVSQLDKKRGTGKESVFSELHKNGIQFGEVTENFEVKQITFSNATQGINLLGKWLKD